MRQIAEIAVITLALAGCNRTPALPVVRTEDVPAPAKLEVKVQHGDNLRAIGAGAYGHERFSGFVARVNGIADPERLAAGVTLKTPSLSVAFRDAGLSSQYQPAINVLSKACTDFHDVLPAFRTARHVGPVTNGHFPISRAHHDTFLKCATGIEAACRVLRDAKAPHAVPQKAINQFTEVARLLRELATGSVEPNGYDYDLVGQRFGLAFTNAMVWTQNAQK